jgi:uncharacterized protein (DUF488 family)
MHSVIGVGYEGVDLDSFISRLSLRDISTVVDVRLTPLSRKQGFSKNALRAALASVGIDYVHLSALGNPKDNRDAYHSAEDEHGKSARERFSNILRGELADAAIDDVISMARTGNVAVLCFEQSDEHCHRQQVLAAVSSRVAVAV